MKPIRLRTITLYCIALLYVTVQYGLTQLSGPQYYRSAVMDGNTIRTVFGNWGVIAQPMDNGPRGAWMRSSNGYIGDESFFVGVLLPVKDYNTDGIPDTIHSVITCPVSRPATSADRGPNGEAWTFMPHASTVNASSDKVPISKDNTSWPTSWGGLWNGLHGPGKYVGDLEAFYTVDDQNDVRFNFAQNNPHGYVFHPDSNNPAVTGQGIQVDVRYVQLNSPMFKDVLFRIYDIQNLSTYRYEKVVFGYLMGTYVGVTGNYMSGNEYDDDYTVLYKSKGVAITGDFGNSCARNPLWVGPVGKYGNAFIGPKQNTIASFMNFAPSNDIPLGNDEQLWQRLTPGIYNSGPAIANDITPLYGQDADYVMGTDYFSLDPGESTQIVSALVYGYTVQDILHKTMFARLVGNNNFDKFMFGTSISMKNFTEHVTVSLIQEIQWETIQSGGTVDIFFIKDGSDTPTTVGLNVPNTGSVQWYTPESPDCYFGKLRIFLKDSSGNPVDYTESRYFTINNSGNGHPSLMIPEGYSPFFNGAVITEEQQSMVAFIGDPESDPLSLNVFCDYGAGFVHQFSQFVQTSVDSQIFIINLASLPNSNAMTLRFDLSDGTNTTSYTTGTFSKQNPRTMLSPSKATFIAKNTSYGLDAVIIDFPKLTNDSYIISFSDSDATARIFSVYNTTKNIYTIHEGLLPLKGESPSFDGLALQSNDAGTNLKQAQWNRPALQNLFTSLTRYDFDSDNDGTLDVKGFRHPCDYTVVFYNTIVDTVIDAWAQFGVTQTPLNYKIFNSRNEQVKVLYDEPTGGVHSIYLYENVGGTWRYTWSMAFIGDSIPMAGDTLSILMHKGLSVYDSLRIDQPSAIANTTLQLPGTFQLHQNFPNPFNPTTTIRYALPYSVHVKLTIHDILGREVAVLVNDRQSAGWNDVLWNANGMASGIYFYRLQAGSYSESKKLLMVK
ncbi:MAG: T9SS type A sorting domain-containing protein [Bacteroidetes bacterium]|nr:T9SS type A sorting domain-containing protein [Bacteroidota bacterium]